MNRLSPLPLHYQYILITDAAKKSVRAATKSDGWGVGDAVQLVIVHVEVRSLHGTVLSTSGAIGARPKKRCSNGTISRLQPIVFAGQIYILSWLES